MLFINWCWHYTKKQSHRHWSQQHLTQVKKAVTIRINQLLCAIQVLSWMLGHGEETNAQEVKSLWLWEAATPASILGHRIALCLVGPPSQLLLCSFNWPMKISLPWNWRGKTQSWLIPCRKGKIYFVFMSKKQKEIVEFCVWMPSNHLILCWPLFLPPSIFPSIRVFSNT